MLANTLWCNSQLVVSTCLLPAAQVKQSFIFLHLLFSMINNMCEVMLANRKAFNLLAFNYFPPFVSRWLSFFLKLFFSARQSFCPWRPRAQMYQH